MSATQKFKMATIFFKMADMSGKEIIKFTKNVPTCPIGMIMVSNRIVKIARYPNNSVAHMQHACYYLSQQHRLGCRV